MHYSIDKRTDRERELEYQLEQMRDEEQRRNKEAEEARQERLEEYRRQSLAADRTASSWPEALRKQAYLYRREANEAGEYDAGNYFGNSAAACERALEIWKELIPPDPAGVSSIFNVVMTLDTRYYAYSYRRVLSDLYVVSNLR